MDGVHQRACYCYTDYGQQTKSHGDECLLPTHVIADYHVKKAYRSIEKFAKYKKHSQVVAGDFNAELGLEIGIECLSVGPYTLKKSNKREDWMQQLLMVQRFVALNTMYKKCQRNSKDAEANDMVHMGSDHRCGMAQLVFPITNKERRPN